MPIQAGQRMPTVRANTATAVARRRVPVVSASVVSAPVVGAPVVSAPVVGGSPALQKPPPSAAVFSVTTADVPYLMDSFARTGDERAFEEIVHRYSGMVHAVCSQVTRNAHDAEDATQAVFLTLALELRGGGTPIRALGAWLQQVAHRVSLDLYKSRKRRVAREDRCRQMTLSEDRAFSPPADVTIDDDELKLLLRDELNQLPTRYRTPMILYYFGGMTPVSIARQLGCRPKALGMRLFRGRKMLAEQLASRGMPVGAAALAAALASALTCTVQGGVAEALAGASSAAAAGAGSGAGAGASFGFNITCGFNAGPVFGPSYGVGNVTRDLAPIFLRVASIARSAAGTGIKLTGRAKLAMALALLIASGVGGSSQLVRNVVSAAEKSWISPLKWRIGEEVLRLMRAVPDALPKPTISLSRASTIAPEAPAPHGAVPNHDAFSLSNLPAGAFVGVAPRLQTGFAIAPHASFMPTSYDGPTTPAPFGMAQSRSTSGGSDWRERLFAGSIASGSRDPFRLPSHENDRQTSASTGPLASTRSTSSPRPNESSGAPAGRGSGEDAVASHAIAAINHWMEIADRRSRGSDDGSAGDDDLGGSGPFGNHEHLASSDPPPALSAAQWLEYFTRMAAHDERFSLLDPQTLVDLAQRAAQDGWDWRILTVDRLAKALGLTGDVGGTSGGTPTSSNTNSVLSVGHSITPVPEPIGPGVISLAIAGTLARRRRRRH